MKLTIVAAIFAASIAFGFQLAVDPHSPIQSEARKLSAPSSLAPSARATALVHEIRASDRAQVSGPALALQSIHEQRRERAIAAYNSAADAADVYEYDQAVRLYRKAIRWLPDFYQAHSNLGGVLIKMRRYAEAERALNQALKIQPNDHISIMMKSQIWRVQENYARAIQVLDLCFQLARKGQISKNAELDCRHRRAHYYDKAGRWHESYAEFAQLANERPDDLDVLYSRCLLSLRLEEYVRAKAEFDVWKQAADKLSVKRGQDLRIVDWRLSRVQEMIDVIEGAQRRQVEARSRRWPPWSAEAWRELMSKHPPRETRMSWWLLTSH